MNKETITREQLLELTAKYSYSYIRKHVLHCRDDVLFRLMNTLGIPKAAKHERRIYPEISEFQKQFILGSLLGDASIVKKGPQYRLSITHNECQREYIEHKKQILDDLSLARIQDTVSKSHNARIWIRGELVDRNIKETNGCLLHSKVHPYFNELRNSLYHNNTKAISQWWLDQITPISLAYWIMDDGAAEYSDNSYVLRISTYGFTIDDHYFLRDMLNDRFGIDMQIQHTPGRGFGVTTRFRTSDAKKLRDLIAPYIPDCMRYKIDYASWLAKKMVG